LQVLALLQAPEKEHAGTENLFAVQNRSAKNLLAALLVVAGGVWACALARHS
jgi:hypothetical protein